MIAARLDPYAVGFGFDGKHDEAILEASATKSMLTAWSVGHAIRDVLQAPSTDAYTVLSRLAGRGSTVLLRFPFGLSGGLDTGFSERSISRSVSHLKWMLSVACEDLIIDERPPAIHRYGWLNTSHRRVLEGDHRYGAKLKAASEEEERLSAAHAMTSDIMHDLAQGQPVIGLLDNNVRIPERINAITSCEATIKPFTGDDILDLLKLTHSTTGGIARDALRDRLPTDSELAALPPAILFAAFAMPTTFAVVECLAEQVALGIGEEFHSEDDTTQEIPYEARGPKLADLKGQAAASRELWRIVADLRDWQEGEIAWSEIETSILFYGPPGAGKSMAATALSNELGVPLIDGSIGRCQSKGPLSDTLKAAAEAVKTARESAPSILLMDELDSLMDRDRGTDNGYMRLLVNAQLESLTNIQGYEGVILIGTTNNLDDIDPAIARSGRFDVKVRMELPDLAGLTEIVLAGIGDHLAPGVAEDPEVRSNLRRLNGCSGADAATLARRARGVARQRHRVDGSGKLVTAQDLQDVVQFTRPKRDDANEYLVAIHEAGHAVVGVISGLGYPQSVFVQGHGGAVDWHTNAGLTEALLRSRIVTSMAGGAAEEIFLGARTAGSGIGPDSDLAAATRLVLQMKRQFGLAPGRFAWQPVEKSGEFLYKDDREWVDQHLREADQKAREILERSWTLVEHLAAELVKSRELDQGTLHKLFENFPDPWLQEFLEATYRCGEAKGTRHEASNHRDPPNRRLTLASSVRPAQSTHRSRQP
ncbi:AAA family ATPase [Roseivivax sp. THAF30]|uniref:AAA family ATPase n=1 Tax=Roseivivax sp. THAF30 TaxID=2587852 RepID=UPI001562D37B|nr:AAA family ATPase [Roseivivax sp. THAF30]